MNARGARSWTTGLIQGAHMASLYPSWRRFARAATQPRQAQLAKLHHIVQSARNTAWGRAHHLDNVRDLQTFRRCVPPATYETLRPWIERAAAGETRALTGEAIVLFERTSGSTHAQKLVPYTRALRAEFNAATGPWLFVMYRQWPALFGTRSYWSISPVVRQRSYTSGGIPIGIEDDSEYFHPVERWAIKRCMAVDQSVARAPSMDAWLLQTARQLLRATDLGFLSVWSPTFLLQLMKGIEANLEALLPDLPLPRQRALADRPLVGKTLWPNLALLSCWTEGASAQFIPALRRYFPHTPLEPKGLLATEGVLSIPVGQGPGAAVAVTSHFFEFIDLDHPNDTPRLVDELQPGATYTPLLTTSGGLYRYRLPDRIAVLPQRFGALPRIKFLGRLDGESDLCGEKLHPSFAQKALENLHRVLQQHQQEARFTLLAPVLTPARRYVVFVESNAPHELLQRATSAVEEALCTSYHYRYCRDLQQLQPVQLHRVTHGWHHYQKRLMQEGIRAGDIKPRHLDLRTDWPQYFPSQAGAPPTPLQRARKP